MEVGSVISSALKSRTRRRSLPLIPHGTRIWRDGPPLLLKSRTTKHTVQGATPHSRVQPTIKISTIAPSKRHFNLVRNLTCKMDATAISRSSYNYFEEKFSRRNATVKLFRPTPRLRIRATAIRMRLQSVYTAAKTEHQKSDAELQPLESHLNQTRFAPVNNTPPVFSALRRVSQATTPVMVMVMWMPSHPTSQSMLSLRLLQLRLR